MTDTNYTVYAPAEGKLVLELSWDDAEILTRLIGLTNSGSLQQHSKPLHNLVGRMVELVGRNAPKQARRYRATISSGQVWVYDEQNPPF
jgi:hypothetical protein